LTTAQLALIHAESNRNKEVRSEPFDLNDFCFFNEIEEKPKPPSAAGAALLALLDQDLLPAFAFNGPWLEDLAREGKGIDPPSRLCWASEDAILLAPWRVSHEEWGGMLIAMQSANDAVRTFYDEKGASVTLRIPENVVPKNAFSAADGNAILMIARRENLR
jgi:hypothetical protein